MTPKAERDEWLMAQVAQGQRDLLEPLIRRYASPLLTFIQRMVGDPHQSEDIFQDVFLAVWTKRHQYQFPRPFKAWLYAIAVNRCRAQGRRQQIPLVAFSEGGSAVVPGPSPADAVVATETAALVLAAVAELPPQQRAVVALRVWNGMSYLEIANVLERTEVTVRSHMHHGLAAMRRFLEPRLTSR